MELRPGDTELVIQDTRVTARTRLDQILAFAKSAEPRAVLPGRAVVIDIVLAACVVAASLTLTSFSTPRAIPPNAVVAAVVTSAPLAARRRYPLTALFVLLLGAVVTRRYATDITFLTLVFAAYSAVVYSRFRGAAQLSVPMAGVFVVAAFWKVTPASAVTVVPVARQGFVTGPLPQPVAHVAGLISGPGGPGGPGAQWRLAAIMVLFSLVLIAIVGNAVHAGDRIRLLQAEHETATRRAVEVERARIASELHDVVTHNVSVMIVQAGAARQVLADAPDQARASLLAVESSGRAAMTELRHLLGLLSPFGAPGDGAPGDGAPGGGAEGLGAASAAGDMLAGEDLRPQPGLGQLQALVDRVSAAGLPIELQVSEVPPDLPPGQDLAAFRVVQEALTNVIKHAGKPRTSVRLDCREGDLVVEVADAGRPIPAAGPAVSGGGRGLLGLRERMALYGGGLEAGPRPGGGWLVRARMPVEPQPTQAPGAWPTGSDGLTPITVELR